MDVRAVLADSLIVEAPRLLASRAHRVALDHGQFYLSAAVSGAGDLIPDLVGIALTSGIAQGDGQTVVMSPHQYNSNMALEVELWSADPPSDTDAWEEVFEFALNISEHGLYYSSTVGQVVDLDVPPGRYHAVVTGRGFVARGWPGSEPPADSWRIRLYPADGPREARRIRQYVPPSFVTPPPQFADAGAAALEGLQRVLDGRAQLSGRPGTARASRTMPGTRREVFRYLKNPSGWLTQSSVGGDESYWLLGGADTEGPWNEVNRIVPTGGRVHCVLLDARSPEYVEVTWSWDLHVFGPGVDETWTPIVVSPPVMTLRFDLGKGRDEADWPTIVVRVTHSQVPEEFVDELSVYWDWMLERADYVFDLSDRRMKQARAAQHH